jgi:uncharacterized protein (TIGR03435 family)
MLRNVLVERLGLVWHLNNKNTPIYALMRGDGQLKLARAAEIEPGPVAMGAGVFKRKSASLADFASFLSGLAGREVVDRTGVQGQFKFDVDWNQDVPLTSDLPSRDPGLVITKVKQMGLKIEPRNELTRTMVIDRVNKTPTPN